MLPDELTQTDATQLSPVAMASIHRCDRRSHSLTVLSADPEAIMSSLSAYTAMICPEWPFSCPTVWPVLQSEIMIFPSPWKRKSGQGGYNDWFSTRQEYGLDCVQDFEVTCIVKCSHFLLSPTIAWFAPPTSLHVISFVKCNRLENTPTWQYNLGSWFQFSLFNLAVVTQ